MKKIIYKLIGCTPAIMIAVATSHVLNASCYQSALPQFCTTGEIGDNCRKVNTNPPLGIVNDKEGIYGGSAGSCGFTTDTSSPCGAYTPAFSSQDCPKKDDPPPGVE